MTRDLSHYVDLVRLFPLVNADTDKRAIGKQMAQLLCSKSISIRRSAKYKLRDWFGAGNPELAKWNDYGPPEEAEIIWWEKYFQN